MPDAIDSLLDADVFARTSPDELFLRACRFSVERLTERFPTYRTFLQERGYREISTLADVHALPAIFLPILKSIFFPLPADMDIVVRLTSSGTTGKPSVTPLDEPSMRRRVQSMLASYRAAGIVSGSIEALAFLIDPSQTQMAGSVVIDAALSSDCRCRSAVAF